MIAIEMTIFWNTFLYIDALQNHNKDEHDALGTNTPLLSNDSPTIIKRIPGPTPLQAIDWSGTDCDMSWVCLFIFILALCFVIPLIYVLYIAEHAHSQDLTHASTPGLVAVKQQDYHNL